MLDSYSETHQPIYATKPLVAIQSIKLKWAKVFLDGVLVSQDNKEVTKWYRLVADQEN